MRALRILVPALLTGLALAATRAHSEGDAPPIQKLEDHPLTDAKPGEWLRFKNVSGGQTTWIRVEVLATKPEEKKVFVAAWQVSEDGKERIQLVENGHWIDIPPFAPKEHQEFKKDQMVEIELAGRKLRCRHIKIVEQVNPPMPAPTRTREVWYTNEALASGKVQEFVDNPPAVRTVVDWGTMTAEELTAARKPYGLDGKAEGDGKEGGKEGGNEGGKKDEPAPPEGGKPAGEKPASSCGSSCGGGK